MPWAVAGQLPIGLFQQLPVQRQNSSLWQLLICDISREEDLASEPMFSRDTRFDVISALLTRAGAGSVFSMQSGRNLLDSWRPGMQW
jgi:hypothetical protein